jgi:hypothetical protein
MDENGTAIERAARQAIDEYVDNAVAIPRERAEVADNIGDLLGAEAWRDIADEVERLLRT